jgi:hypothetical protein
MGASIRWLRWIGAVLACTLLFGCARAPQDRQRSVLLGAENRVFLILPLNIAMAMPPELELPSPILWAELERTLRAHDKQLKTVARQVARDLWVRSIQQARAGEKGARAGYDDAARALVFELQKHAAFDAMIAPSLVVREAPLSNRTASWDGVERELAFEDQGFEARTLAAETPLEGTAPAATLHVAIFDAKGEKLHEGKGGIDLLVRARVEGTDPSGAPIFQFTPRADPFQDREHLREGIDAAFLPFLLPPPE